jgi:hypothetical protein
VSGVHASDVRAALERAGHARAARRLDADAAAGRTFASHEELLAAHPPDALAISPGAHAAVLGPLFGEFE